MIINYKIILLIFLLFMSISIVSATEITNTTYKIDNCKSDNNLKVSDGEDNFIYEDDNNLKVSDGEDNFIYEDDNNLKVSDGEDNFNTLKSNSSSKSTHIELISPENWKVYGGETYKIKLLDENNTSIIQSRVDFIIKNPNNIYLYYGSFTDYEGIANLPLNFDIKGIYNIQAIFYGNSEYAPSEPINSNVILYKKTVIQTPKKYAYRKSNFSVQLLSINNEPLSYQKLKLIIDDITYLLTTDSKGFVSVQMPSNKKTVNLHCIFSGGDYYESSDFYMKLPVYKKTVIKPLVYSVLKGKYFKILLKGIDGKILTKQKVKFTINGISYFRTTNSKGIASLKITIKRNKYSIFFEFDNNNIYGPYSGSSVLNVVDPSGQFKKGLNQKVKSSFKKYLSGGGYAKVTKYIKRVSKSITKKYSTKFEKMVAIFNYVRDNLKYSFYLNSKKGASKTLKTKRGNCCDHASLIIALCRASKIPARYSHAKKCRFNSGLIVGHVWAQIYVGGRWYSADATSYSNSLGHIGDWNTKKHGNIHIYRNIPF